MPYQPVIDGLEFASAGAAKQGVWPLRDFPRLRDVLASDAGEVAYEIKGVHDERGRPSLQVKVRGALQLHCQRCLEPMQLEVDTETLLVLAATLAEIHGDPADVQSPDRLLAGKEMPVRDLIEDELILAVPYAPRHESCNARPAPGADGKTLPFAGLKSLIRGKH